MCFVHVIDLSYICTPYCTSYNEITQLNNIDVMILGTPFGDVAPEKGAAVIVENRDNLFGYAITRRTSAQKTYIPASLNAHHK